MAAKREIIVGVSGGIAAYKSASLVSQLVQADVGVTVVMTEAAKHFVGEATFAALAGRPVASDSFDPSAFPLGAHIELARKAELLCVAPATANYLAQAADGLASDLLSTLTLCFKGPILVAPAMNNEMWTSPSVQRNVAQLIEDGVHTIGPNEGWLSCRERGPGRMAEPEEIAAEVHRLLSET